MTHILISYKDNPSFSLCTGLKNNEGLNDKQWIGFNAHGEELFYTNTAGVEHILIQNCSLDEFNRTTSSCAIKYRVVEDNELIESDLFDDEFNLDLSTILSRDAYILKAAPEVEIKKTYEQKLAQSAHALVSKSIAESKASIAEQKKTSSPAPESVFKNF